MDLERTIEEAEKGNLITMRYLGALFRDGDEVLRDYLESAKWYRKAADLGDCAAQIEMAKIDLLEWGFAKDEVEAVKWFRKAADQGDAMAQCDLGSCYELGTGVAVDLVEAYGYFSLAGIILDFSRTKRDKLEIGMPYSSVLRGQQRAKELQKEIEDKMAAKKSRN